MIAVEFGTRTNFATLGFKTSSFLPVDQFGLFLHFCKNIELPFAIWRSYAV